MRAPGEKVVNSQAARITVLRRSDVADDVTGIVGDVLMDKCSKHRTNAYFDPQGVSMARAPIKFQLLAKAGFPIERFRSGKAIFDEGGKGDKMYVVCSGEVTIERGGKIVEALSAGDIFGEMALIDGRSRSATARAKSDCEVAPITEKAFVSLVHETPLFALSVMHNLADRLRRANERS